MRSRPSTSSSTSSSTSYTASTTISWRSTPVCLFSVHLLCGGLACGGDDVAQTDSAQAGTSSTGDATTPATTGADTTATTTTAVTPTTTAAESTTDATDATTGPALPDLEVARGIRLTRVTATQGVQTEIVRDGLEVAPEEYAVALISRRKTVLRADWSLHAAFTPRELIGRLTIWTPEGDTHVDEFKTFVDAPSNDGDLFKTFAWQLPADLVRPGMEYRIEAFEADPALATGEVSDPPPVLPLPGRGTLVVEDNPMKIKVLLVPIKHVFEGDTCMPEIFDVDIKAMRLEMEQHNAVEIAEITLGEPLEYKESIGTAEDGFVPVLTALGIRRAADKPPDNLYYYGLITSCDSYPPGLLGQAYAITDDKTPEFAFQRIATGRYQGSGEMAKETFVHEVGHCQGRYHIRCSGGEAGTDDNYPYPNGRIGVWGYGIHDTKLRSPTGFRDYMSYCDRSFVSDYGWDLTYAYIKELSSWDAAAPPPAPDAGPLLLGTVYTDGTSQWWTTHGSVPRRGSGPTTLLEFTADGETVALPASFADIPHSTAHAVAVRLPDRWSAVKKIALRVDGKLRASAPRSAVRELHLAP